MVISEEIFPQYVYMTIPADYVCVYHKLIGYIADFGKDIIDDCTASCSNKGKNIISCWNLFQAAVASYNEGKIKQANFYIDYIEKQLDNIYKSFGGQHIPTSMPVKITDDGKLKAIVSCDNGVKFFVDVETGQLYQEYLNEQGKNQKYHITEDDLIYEKNNINKD